MEDFPLEGISHHIRLKIGPTSPEGADEGLAQLNVTAIKSDSCPEYFDANTVCRLVEDAAMQGGFVAIDLIIEQLHAMRTGYVEAIGRRPGFMHLVRRQQAAGPAN